LSTKAQTPIPHQPEAAALSEDDLQTVAGGTFVKSWSTSGDADDRPTEEVAFYYNRIAFNYAMTKDGKG
jgi:hypothetical protein